MSAIELLQQGDVEQALSELKRQVRDQPQDAAARIFLFQLMAVMGQWEKARTQLKVCGDLDPAAEMMVTAYTSLIGCEQLRQEIFAGRRTPLVLGEPEPWVAWMIQALERRCQGDFEAAESLRAEALEAAPATAGSIRYRASGQGDQESLASDSFEWIADADMQLGPVLEAVVDGRYFWVPMNHVQSIRIEPPTDLRDMVWLPVQFTWIGGGQQLGFVPTRYYGSEASEDGAIRLARKTDWQEMPGGLSAGSGQRLLATDEKDYPILDVREIDFKVSPAVLPVAGAESVPSGTDSLSPSNASLEPDDGLGGQGDSSQENPGNG